MLQHILSRTMRCSLVTCSLRIVWLLSLAICGASSGGEFDKQATQWRPFVEWTLKNDSYKGNPFDVRARVTFTHPESGERRTTEMFYDGDDTWRFRFTATRPGKWTLATESDDKDLTGHQGVVDVKPNPAAYGFVTHVGNRWARPYGTSGTLRPLVPQFVMYAGPDVIAQNIDKMDQHIKIFIEDHGFTGFHVPVLCRWFDINTEHARDIDASDPNPDPRTFRALEQLITRTHAAGGVVHFWAWGDESRTQTPTKWGINGAVDKRLQRYIAARLGPLPGWTMGYGFDLWEWVDGPQLSEWHRHMHEHFGWPHMLGARSANNELTQISEDLDYASYEQHRPDYPAYLATINQRPNKPAFSEDRFRIRQSEQYREKDYTEELTRRGLWHSAMVGGVANIWGRLDGGRAINIGGGASRQYDHPQVLKTCTTFFHDRLDFDLVPHVDSKTSARADDARASVPDGTMPHCLRSPEGDRYLFYAEDTDTVVLDLSQSTGSRRAVAVDAKQAYREIDQGTFDAQRMVWHAPHRSDWAIAVGEFPGADDQ